jgi:outer membrane protein TolC
LLVFIVGKLLAAHSAIAEKADAPAPPAFFAGNEELNAYLLEATENHPLLKSHYQDWYAAMARIPQAMGLDDPMFSYSQMLKSDESYFTVGLEQKLPWFGIRRLRGEAAAAEADYWLEHLYAQRNFVLYEVKRAYYEYAFLKGRAETMEGQINIMEVLLDIARYKYEGGFGSQSELVRVDIELSRMRDMLAEMRQMRPALSASLARAVGRPQDTEMAWPQSAAFPAAPPSADLLGGMLRANNPSLKMYDAMIAARETEAELARRSNRPDITIGAEYTVDRNMRRDPRDPFSPGRLSTYKDIVEVATGQATPDLGMGIDAYDAFGYKEWLRPAENELAVNIGINVPIWRKKRKAAIAEKEHEAHSQAWHKEDEAQGMESMARMVRFQWDDADRRLALYVEDLVPKEEMALQALHEGYVAGDPDASFPMLLESMRNLMQLRTEKLRAERDKHLAAAQLELLLGQPWESVLPGTASPTSPDSQLPHVHMNALGKE